MSQPDFARAWHYALTRLENDLASNLYYHSIRHTRDDVVPAVDRLAALEGVTGEDLMLLRTAAYFHDIGFVERYADNEPIAVRIASDALPGFGFAPQHVAVIAGIIMATKLPQMPHTHLEEIMADADLDVLGRVDYFDLNQALRAELEAAGSVASDREWHIRQLDFLLSHRYFTASAKRLRDADKWGHIETLKRLLDHYPRSS